MSQKTVDIPGIGDVVLAKRKGSRNLRITIRPDGSVRVGMPAWAPYQAGIKFAQSRADWIARHRPPDSQPGLKDGARIGKSFRLEFRIDKTVNKPRARLIGNRILVHTDDAAAAAAQAAAVKASEKALRKDAEKLLAIRLDDLAKSANLKYKDLTIKKLKSRWGSCSAGKEISLNYYLIQLPWRLIDYVIMHELMHTRHMNHSAEFWNDLGHYIHDLKSCRQDIKEFRPLLHAVA